MLRHQIWPKRPAPMQPYSSRDDSYTLFINDVYDATIKDAKGEVLRETTAYAKSRFTPIPSTLPTIATPHPANQRPPVPNP